MITLVCGMMNSSYVSLAVAVCFKFGWAVWTFEWLAQHTAHSPMMCEIRPVIKTLSTLLAGGRFYTLVPGHVVLKFTLKVKLLRTDRAGKLVYVQMFIPMHDKTMFTSESLVAHITLPYFPIVHTVIMYPQARFVTKRLVTRTAFEAFVLMHSFVTL